MEKIKYKHRVKWNSLKEKTEYMNTQYKVCDIIVNKYQVDIYVKKKLVSQQYCKSTREAVEIINGAIPFIKKFEKGELH